MKTAQSATDPSKVYLTMFRNAFIESGKHSTNFPTGAETKMKGVGVRRQSGFEASG
ncbi:MAG: hypothetical protein HY774_06660 [Acidobacteria bacterium]|nr:hypothetical protein [Acidobacteriota bacterium]